MAEFKMNDGWDLENCFPLEDIELAISDLEQLAYELRNCVRQHSLQSMRDKLRDAAERIISNCDEIQDYDTIKEVQ